MNPNGTTTLAESLLLDLDDLSDDNEEEEEEVIEDDENGVVTRTPMTVTETSENDSMKDTVNFHDLTGLHLLESTSWKSHRNDIQRLLSSKDSSSSNNNFEMLIKSTPFLSLMDNEMLRAHDELVHSYGKQYFPELSDLIIDPKQYHLVVSILFREQTLETISSPRISEELSQILTSNQFLTVSVAASTSTIMIPQQNQDSNNNEEEKKKELVSFILNYVDQLLECNQELIAFVEKGMQQYAPNITILVGSAKCAAKLIGAAGGLEELCQMPACNLQVLGRTTGNNNNTKSTVQGDGSILWNYCDMIVNCRPRSLQPKLCKQVANKLALVARCDLSNRSKSTIDTSQGLKFRQIIQDKYQKLQEPDKAPVVKALPK